MHILKIQYIIIPQKIEVNFRYNFVNYDQIGLCIKRDNWSELWEMGGVDPLPKCFLKLFFSEILIWHSDKNYNVIDIFTIHFLMFCGVV